MTNDMQGKICLVTGSTSGIGQAIAKQLAHHGAHVVLMARDAIKAEATRAAIVKETGNTSVEICLADLSSQASIRAGVADFRKRFPKLHVLVNQAGLVQTTRTTTVDGLETMFAVNYLAYFMLVNLLREELKAGAPSRVMNVTGGIEAAAQIDFDDLQSEKKFGWFKTLGQSKLADVLFTYEASRRLSPEGIAVNVLNPNGVRTNLGKDAKGVPGFFMGLFSRFFPLPDDAAKKFVNVLVAKDLEGVTGQFFKPDGKTQGKSSKQSYDEGVAKRLWEVSEKLTGLGQ